jgi:hypothetical protein
MGYIMFERAVRPGAKPVTDLRYMWLITMVGVAAVVLFGSLALLVPPGYGDILVIAIGVFFVLGFCLWVACLFCIGCEEKANKDQ